MLSIKKLKKISNENEHNKDDRPLPGHPSVLRRRAKDLFGRDEDIENFSQLVLLERQIVLFGKSGLGKSSLLNAGVVPKLGGKDNYEAFQIRFNAFTPDKEDSPLSIIRSKISEHINFDNFLWDKIIQFHPGKIDKFKSIPSIAILSDLWYYIKSIQIQDPNKNIFVLVLDQFEELFTYPDEQVVTFSRELAHLVNVHMPPICSRPYPQHKTGKDELTEEESHVLFRPLNIKIIISIRSDKMSLLNNLKDYNPGILQKTYELRPLEIHQAQDAILQPAGLKDSETIKFNSPPFQYSAGALDAMVAFLSKGGQQKIETFQLQILCKYAENKSLGKTEEPRVITAEDLGKVEDIFENYYDDRISTVPADQQLKVRKFIEEGLIFEEDMRRLSMYEGQAERQYDISEELLSQLVDTRLIRTEPHSAGGFSYEISHDTLVAPILKAKARRLAEEKLEEEKKRRKEEEEKKILVMKERQRKISRRYKAAGLVVIGICIALGISFLREQKAYDELMTLVKENATERYNRNIDKGKELQKDGKYDEALQVFSSALEIVRNYNNKYTLTRLDSSEAFIMIQKCYEEKDSSIVISKLIKEGDSLILLGPDHYGDAKHIYSKAIRKDSDNVELQGKIVALDAKIDKENAKIDEKVEKYKEKARSLFEKGYKSFALEWLEEAKKIKKSDPEIDALEIEYKK